ncbi:MULTISPECIES: Asp-tRNA(Asn)/Glu-tRNA(Gln) amidotransferase subunit GatA [unclassified Facklamia]|uniref:Asp-tRNA(Asn)/Glu-tRNA(Gln) amidotransferase subunit GatA n=1 Tax=Aerococcaceae TaxID=186827 RepID=UPI0013BB07E5|nr:MULTISPECIES: Asp-tRNA(Asn)/Glu-tRNA(Gln) amidotransferase subunit GatA [unclassified Facklamia]NEW64739.1 Asp-tRNA(Asn)/Glu-tRNA(Gln) amidotransferase subunit GatA [Facklamia sp. 252]NEW68064.1 Asp-tRNA(Asn)/Glu-tRNA(Gln) amidotransferase subunit GatA [Facklamia sp. 253]QQD65002.1 Asp-tRNA(Asn)/Glu-tRNA(Gln) amidotransferase subunit GatA [Aerococcaceae bacterium zg-252]
MTVFPQTITEIKKGLKQGDFTAVELVEHTYRQIDEIDAKVESFLALNKEAALEAARLADERGYGDDAPVLNGVPIAVKDNIVTKGLTTTAASKMLEDFVPTYDATVVEKLKAAGAIIIGKVNLDEFAMGASTERSAYKITRNPWNLDRVPGGSSGGSGAVVASRQVPASLGTDTGGSIRQPAAFNGIVGLKPTYGTVSRYGLIAFGSSLDQIGPMTLTVEDNVLLLDVIAGHDVHDSTSLSDLPMNYGAKIGQSLEGMKIAFPKEYKAEVIAPEIREAMEQAAAYFQSQGAIVEEVSLPLLKYGINVYYIISSAEASSNLQRFDGVRYGYRSESAKTLEQVYVQSRSEGFGEEVKRRIMLGTYSLSSGQFDKFFKQAAQVRTMIKQELDRVFAEYDVIMGPTTTSTAFEIGGRVKDPIAMYVEDLLTVTANIAGLPGISIPAGFDQAGLPIGLQLMAKPLDEATLYQVAYDFERSHDFAAKAPVL